MILVWSVFINCLYHLTRSATCFHNEKLLRVMVL